MTTPFQYSYLTEGVLARNNWDDLAQQIQNNLNLLEIHLWPGDMNQITHINGLMTEISGVSKVWTWRTDKGWTLRERIDQIRAEMGFAAFEWPTGFDLENESRFMSAADINRIARAVGVPAEAYTQLYRNAGYSEPTSHYIKGEYRTHKVESAGTNLSGSSMWNTYDQDFHQDSDNLYSTGSSYGWNWYTGTSIPIIGFIGTTISIQGLTFKSDFSQSSTWETIDLTGIDTGIKDPDNSAELYGEQNIEKIIGNQTYIEKDAIFQSRGDDSYWRSGSRDKENWTHSIILPTLNGIIRKFPLSLTGTGTNDDESNVVKILSKSVEDDKVKIYGVGSIGTETALVIGIQFEYDQFVSQEVSTSIPPKVYTAYYARGEGEFLNYTSASKEMRWYVEAKYTSPFYWLAARR